MGSPETEKGRTRDEGPPHQACTAGFWLGQYEVTVGQYRIFTEATDYDNNPDTLAVRHSGCWTPSDNAPFQWTWMPAWDWKMPGFRPADDYPVSCVSFYDVSRYLTWMNHLGEQQYRLPTELEWEYAARGGTQTARYWGDTPDQACLYANVADHPPDKPARWSLRHPCRDGHDHAAPVGQFQPNPLGLYDILGNVWEWTCSEGPAAYSGPIDHWTVCARFTRHLVFRGGSWAQGPADVRSSRRLGHDPEGRSTDLGFRVVMTPGKP